MLFVEFLSVFIVFVFTPFKITLLLFDVSFSVERAWKMTSTLKFSLLLEDVATISKYLIPTSDSFVDCTFKRFPSSETLKFKLSTT
jgi:hypothetical protein